MSMSLADIATAPGLRAGRHRPSGGAWPAVMAIAAGDYRFLLLLRFVLINAVAAAMLAAAWAQGWLDDIVRTDTSHLCALIFLVFALGLAQCARRVVQTSRELNEIERDGVAGAGRTGQLLRRLARSASAERSEILGAVRLSLANRIAGIRHAANLLVMLGLIGTVLGFIMALGGVDADSAGDASSVGPMVSSLVAGMSVALYTTLVGSVLNVWLMLNYRLLEGGAIKLVTAIVERGQADGRA
ncbi:MAG: MotA/TolQ/ExbB proton channel family protein [Geminicoccaceae bacterium]